MLDTFQQKSIIYEVSIQYDLNPLLRPPPTRITVVISLADKSLIMWKHKLIELQKNNEVVLLLATFTFSIFF